MSADEPKAHAVAANILRMNAAHAAAHGASTNVKVSKHVQQAIEAAAASKLAAGYRGMKTRKAVAEDPSIAKWLAEHEHHMHHQKHAAMHAQHRMSGGAQREIDAAQTRQHLARFKTHENLHLQQQAAAVVVDCGIDRDANSVGCRGRL